MYYIHDIYGVNNLSYSNTIFFSFSAIVSFGRKEETAEKILIVLKLSTRNVL